MFDANKPGLRLPIPFVAICKYLNSNGLAKSVGEFYCQPTHRISSTTGFLPSLGAINKHNKGEIPLFAFVMSLTSNHHPVSECALLTDEEIRISCYFTLPTAAPSSSSNLCTNFYYAEHWISVLNQYSSPCRSNRGGEGGRKEKVLLLEETCTGSLWDSSPRNDNNKLMLMMRHRFVLFLFFVLYLPACVTQSTVKDTQNIPLSEV